MRRFAQLARWVTPITSAAILAATLWKLKQLQERLKNHDHDREVIYSHIEEHYPTRLEVDEAITAHVGEMHPDTAKTPDRGQFRELEGH